MHNISNLRWVCSSLAVALRTTAFSDHRSGGTSCSERGMRDWKHKQAARCRWKHAPAVVSLRAFRNLQTDCTFSKKSPFRTAHFRSIFEKVILHWRSIKGPAILPFHYPVAWTVNTPYNYSQCTGRWVNVWNSGLFAACRESEVLMRQLDNRVPLNYLVRTRKKYCDPPLTSLNSLSEELNVPTTYQPISMFINEIWDFLAAVCFSSCSYDYIFLCSAM